MISEFFIGLATGFMTWLASVFGTWTPPTQLTDMATAVSSLIGTFSSLGIWVDWNVLGGCVAAAIAAWAIVLTIKLVRAVASHIPVIGGAGD